MTFDDKSVLKSDATFLIEAMKVSSSMKAYVLAGATVDVQGIVVYE